MKNSPVNLPSTIGVYIFKNRTGEILYIGKSVNIRARVKSHFENAKLDAKERAIVENSSKVDSIPTESEFKALLLESQLIQKHRPKYNKVWMDDKSYLYVKITVGEEYPKISLVRKSDIFLKIPDQQLKNNMVVRNDKNSTLYFGPFSSRRTLEQLLREIRRVIPFCTAKRIGKTPCFYSKINLCFPCPNLIEQLRQNFSDKRLDSYGLRADVNGYQKKNIRKNPPEIRINPEGRKQYIQELKKVYKNNIKQIVKIFEGETDIVLKNLRRELDKLSKTGKYEEAILIRDRISKFEKLISERSFDNSNFSFPEIINTKYNIQILELQKMLKVFFPALTELHRLECYDVSNLGGKQATAAMTVAIDGQIDKSQYRKFKILTNTIKYYPILTNTNKKSDVISAKAGIYENINLDSDFHQNDKKILNTKYKILNTKTTDWQMMLGVLQRRFAHHEWEFPDLLVVDGGKPQVRMAISAMQKLKLQIPVVGIAKNPDRLVIGVSEDNMPTKRPELNHSGFNLIRLLRDEAHRFGRNYHLLLRKKVSGY